MKELGKILKEKREALKLDLGKIHRVTKIQEKYIEAIEEGDEKVFSAEIYYKSFVKSYSKFLGLNGEELLGLYEKRKREKAGETEHDPDDKICQKLFPKAKADKERRSDLKKLFVTLFIGCSLCAAFLYLNSNIDVFTGGDVDNISAGERERMQLRKMKEKEENLNRLEQERALAGLDASSGENMHIPAESASARKAGESSGLVLADGGGSPEAATGDNEKQELVVEAVENVWIKVDGDGKELFQGTIVKGTKKSWTSEKEFTVKIGYTPGVDVYFNGIAVDVDKGAVQDVNTLVLARQS